MTSPDRRLLRHLAWVLAIKLAALFALWWYFVRDDRVSVTAGEVAQHIEQASRLPTGASN
ncbi:MAG TPA: hypothetical protein VFM33_12360 [Aquabacterium sp.]|nr:hypothetical protein [Aquabacterium sp.]